MARWLPVLAVSLALGILTEDAVAAPQHAWRVLALAGLVIGAMRRARPGLRGLAAALTFFASGGGSLAGEYDRADRHRVEGPRDASVEATVCSEPSGRPGWVSLDLCRAAAVAGPDPVRAVPERLRLSGSREDGTEDAVRSLRRGARIRVGVRLRSVEGAANPGVVPAARALARRGIGARAQLRHADLLVEVVDGPGAARQPRRSHIVRVLLDRGESGALLAALALGESGGLPASRRNEFNQLGLAHILAVSGLHLAMLGFFAYSAVFYLIRLGMRSSWLARAGLAARDGRTGAVLVAVALALAYAHAAGGRAPVQRAAVLLGVVVLARLAGRGRSLAAALAAAGLGVLVLEPGALFRAGPQLSFAACAGLMLATPTPAPARALTRALDQLVRAGAAATASTAPILAAHGLGIAPWGLLANLVAVPWTAFVLLPASFVAVGCVGMGWTSGIDLAVFVADATLSGVAGVSNLLPGAPPDARLAAPHSWALVGAVFITFACVRAPRTSLRVACALIVCLWCQSAPRPRVGPPPPRLVAFDVGLGDSVLVQGRSGALLVDGGLARGSGVDQGSRVVVPGLAALGLEKLDVVVASHADLDHRGGLEAVLHHVAVGELWLPHGAAMDRDFDRLRQLAVENGTRVRVRSRRSPIERFGDLAIEVLWPPAVALPGWSRNDRSLVLRVQAGGGPRILLTGDAGERVERALLELGSDFSAEVLKLGHHGSRTASGRAFLARVGAPLALLSAGCHSRGLPADETLARLASVGSTLWWTGRDGALWLSLARPLSAWSQRVAPRRCGAPRPLEAGIGRLSGFPG